jgi:SPX domain protein involved in polyphosphate accumulation
MIRVEGQKHLFREDSGAIVNTDTNGYTQYVKLRNERQKQREEIEGLKNDISEIKSLLMEIINGPRQNSTRVDEQNV